MPAGDPAPLSLVNGRSVTEVAAADRGLLYGDGLFETLAICQGRPALYRRHVRRLEKDCRRLGMTPPDRRVLDREVGRMCQGVSQGVLKIVVTRGSGGRGYRPPRQPHSTRILSIHPWPDYPAHFSDGGITLRVCRTPLGRHPGLAGMKHLNRLEQVLARQEWDDPAVPEGLMLDSEGRVIEGTMSNVFVVRGRRLLTPDLSDCGVAGIMREFVLERASARGVETLVCPLTLAEVEQAEECFVCNSVIGVWPVRRLEAHCYPAGPLTRRLRRSIVNRLPCW